MADPRIPQGNLNRLKASLIWNNFSQLNVTPPFMAREQLLIGWDGDATGRIPTATGLVNSPEPYQVVHVVANLIKSQSLAQAYETQRQTNTLMDGGTIRPDIASASAGLGPYELLNMSIVNIAELRFDGSQAVYAVSFAGYMLINSFLWD